MGGVLRTEFGISRAQAYRLLGPVRTLVDLVLAPEHRRGNGALYGGLDRRSPASSHAVGDATAQAAAVS